MSTINTHTLVSSSHVASTTANAALPTVMLDDGKANTPIPSNNSDTATFSTLARQLSDAATRAEARMGRKGLDVLDPIKGDQYLVSSPKADAVNGRDILISRYFGGSEPPVALAPATLYNASLRPGNFLNRDDRALIADMYAYAQSEGADLAFVDRLANTLGSYRNNSDGRQMLSSNTGSYDADRYKVTFDFTPDDSAIASRILNGSAINSTRIDPGFVRYILDPGFGALGHTGGIPFLERMVNKFSNEGADQPPLGSEFANLDWGKAKDQVLRTVHKDIRLPASTELTEVVNGVRTLTKQAKAAGYSLDETTGDVRLLSRRLGNRTVPSVEEALSVRRVRFRSLVEVIASTRGPLGIQPKWMSSLFQVLRNYRP